MGQGLKTRGRVRAAAAPGPTTLNDLSALSAGELMQLYRAAKTPAIEDLDGRLKGRMLAVPLIKGRLVQGFVKHFAVDGPMPWQGKTFRSLGKQRGEGVNRLFGNRASWYRFETAIGPSRAGDFDALQLDYDLEDNPPFIRPIKDELREVAPGLWLGLAYMRFGGRNRLGLFFGLART